MIQEGGDMVDNDTILAALRQLNGKIDCLKPSRLKGETMTVNELSREWLDSKKGDVNSTKWQAMKSRYHNHIRPVFGRKVLTDLRLSDVQSFLYGLNTKKHKSRWTIKVIRCEFSAMMNYAMQNEYIKTNIVKATKLPKVRQERKNGISLSDYKKLRNVSKGHWMGILVPLLYYTGLRRSEALALTWSNVDLTNHVIKVRQRCVLRIVNGKQEQVIEKGAKSEAGVRDIPISGNLLKILKEYRTGQGARTTYILQQQRHVKPVDFTTAKRNFDRWKKKAGIKKGITMHSLRHSFAINLVRAGIPVNDAMRMMGHSSAEMTLEVYAHVQDISSSSCRKAVDYLDGITTGKV